MPVLQDHLARCAVDLLNACIDTQVDALLGIKRLVIQRTLRGGFLTEQHGLGERRPVIRRNPFVAEQRYFAVPAVIAQRMGGARSALPGADDHHRGSAFHDAAFACDGTPSSTSPPSMRTG